MIRACQEGQIQVYKGTNDECRHSGDENNETTLTVQKRDTIFLSPCEKFTVISLPTSREV